MNDASNIIYVEYQYQLGRHNGNVAYTMKWMCNNTGKRCNEIGWRGQIFFDRGEQIISMRRLGFNVNYLN